MLLDTSAIIEILRNPAGSPSFKRVTAKIGDEEIYVSVIQLAEIADWATRNNIPSEQRVNAVKETAIVVPLDEQICLDAAAIKHLRRAAGREDFGLVDGIILATARSIGQRVLTLDEDFAGEDDCDVVS